MNNTNKRNKRIEQGSAKSTAIIITILILLLIVFLVALRINFLIGEQLRIMVTPEYSEKVAANQENVTLDVGVQLYNKFVCQAVCKYTLIDMSHNVLLDNGTFSSKAYIKKQYSFTIPMNYYGSGTNIYLYRVECQNIDETLCPTNGDQLVRKSLFVVNYHPSAEQSSALESIKNDYAVVSDNVANASMLLYDEGRIIKDVNLSLDTKRYDAIKSSSSSLNTDIQQFLSIWNTDDYVTARSFMADNDIIGKSAALLSNASAYLSYINSTFEGSNVMLGEFNAVESMLQKYREILSHNISYVTSSTRKLTSTTINDVNLQITQFNSKNYNIDTLYHQIVESRATALGIGDVLDNNVASSLSDYYPSIYVSSGILCMLNISNTPISVNGSVINNASIGDAVDFCSYDYDININSIDNASTALNNVCNRASKIMSVVDGMSGSNSTVAGNDSREMLLMEYKLLLDYDAIYGTPATEANLDNGKNAVLVSYESYLRNSLKDNYGVDSPEVLLSNYTINISLFTFNNNNIIMVGVKNIVASCYVNAVTLNGTNIIPSSLTKITVQRYIIRPLTDYTGNYSNISTFAPPNPPVSIPQCCMYGTCQSCEKKTSKNPLILLHGHSFNQDTHAYQSIEIFDSFEWAFAANQSYYPTGMLLSNENATKGILGHYYIPLVSKPTYYLETYNDLLGLSVSESKTGNIDTYALRLKESIDHTISITGSDKVDIVAHSMGGLVVRRYMQVFGTQHVGTVILIATPNNGIDDKTYALCKIFGASNECDDMRPNGVFIKKINDYSSQPDIKNLYLVIGRGCNMDGLDGDGVVNVNSSLIRNIPEDHILYVNGTCSGTTLLHNRLLYVDEYPMVYDFVKSKLNNPD